MDCKNCELHQKRFYCINCSRTRLSAFLCSGFAQPIVLIYWYLGLYRLREHKLKFAKIIEERQKAQEQAERSLKVTEGARIQRAGIFQTESHWRELKSEAEALRRVNDTGKYSLTVVSSSAYWHVFLAFVTLLRYVTWVIRSNARRCITYPAGHETGKSP